MLPGSPDTGYTSCNSQTYRLQNMPSGKVSVMILCRNSGMSLDAYVIYPPVKELSNSSLFFKGTGN